MFNTFIIELRQKAYEKGLDPEELVEKYRKRYDLGIQAGMSEEEIVKRFGKPEDIISSLYQEKNNSPKEETKSNGNFIKMEKLSVRICHNGNVYFKTTKGRQISYSIPASLTEYYKVTSDNKILAIECKLKNYVKNIRGDIEIEIGDEIQFENASIFSHISDIEATNFILNAINGKIEVISADVVINKVICDNNFSLSTISGDIDLNEACGNNMSVSTVSGDLECNALEFNNCSISSVSGDVDIHSMICKQLDCSSVSGDMNISGKVENSHSSTVSGDIYINDSKNCKSVKESIQDLFHKKGEK